VGVAKIGYYTVGYLRTREGCVRRGVDYRKKMCREIKVGHRLSAIVTRTGDQGTTGLGNGVRVDKNSAPIATLGAIDELNSWIGVLIEVSMSQYVKEMFTLVQHDLFDLGAQISVPGTPLLSQTHLTRIEEGFNRMNADLGMLKEFILPGGILSASFGHVARTVCRRAERQLVSLIEQDGMGGSTSRAVDSSLATNFGLCYLNRLSDLLFVAARVENRTANRGDTLWVKGNSLLNK
jgi:cob(I)alamin adenosyltransferase